MLVGSALPKCSASAEAVMRALHPIPRLVFSSSPVRPFLSALFFNSPVKGVIVIAKRGKICYYNATRFMGIEEHK
jgi:hypothetical protein